jgi:hypothetical protein
MTKPKRAAVALPDADADGRTRIARRFRALIEAFTTDMGDKLSNADVALVRQAAAMTVRAEQAQAALLNGQAVDDDQLVRLSNAATRILTVLGAQRARRAKTGRPYGLADIQAALARDDDEDEAP